MPVVGVAMERSLREGLAGLVAAALRPVLERRDTIGNLEGQLSSVETAFSSWNNCMNASFCKWPVIAIIAIGGLILLSILWCVIRCACCGLSCCCEFCYCLKCCECCGCCTPPRNARNKYLDEPWIPPNQGYKSQDPMTAAAAAAFPRIPPGPAAPVLSGAIAAEPPQYAEFDVSRKGGEDALPAMPSWEGASSKKVVLEEEPVELDQLKKPEATGLDVPLLAAPGPASGPSSPVPTHSPAGNQGPYGPPNTGMPDGYFPRQPTPGDPRTRSPQGYNQGNGTYGPPPPLGVSQGYGIGTDLMGQGRQSPRAFNNGGYGQGAGFAPPASRDNYGQPVGQGSYDNYGQQANQGYGMDTRLSPSIPTGAFPKERMTRSPAPQRDYNGNNYNDNRRYAPPGPQRQHSSDSTRPLVQPSPQRQYNNVVLPEPSPIDLRNNTGFDFGSGQSHPSSMGNGNGYGRWPNALQQPQPQPQSQPQPRPQPQQWRQETAYPGYRSYQPAPSQQQQPRGWN